MGEPEDSDLLAAMARGEEAAFGTLIERYEKRLFNRFLRVFRDRDEAADLTQQAFLVLIRNPAAGRSREGSIGPFLFGVARVLILKRLRQMRRPSPPGPDTAGTAAADPLEVSLQREREAKILEGVGSLPPVRRGILLMRETDGLSVREIARRTTLPENTVKSHLRRARMDLRKWLAPYLGRGGES